MEWAGLGLMVGGRGARIFVRDETKSFTMEWIEADTRTSRVRYLGS